MEAVRPSQVYAGGSALGVECICCGTAQTSGSWRKGWEVGPGGQLANFCNKCGQRWAKAGRPGSLAELHAAEERKAAAARAAAPAGGGGGPSSAAGAKRPASALDPPAGAPRGDALAAVAGAVKRARALAPSLLAPLSGLLPRPRRLPSEGSQSPADSPLDSPDDMPLSLGWSDGGAPSPVHESQAQASGSGAAAEAAPAAPLVLPGGRRVVSYAVQKLSSARANHAAFWLQDEAGESVLAVVGTDVRQSGHFTYAAAPAFLQLLGPRAPPLRCTNRDKVQAWLAALGVTRAVEPDSVRLPELSAEERQRLLNPDEPAWAKPGAAALAGSWRGVREESGRLSDGRHFKRYWLLPSGGGREKLVATGVDSPRRDRRYKYFAEESLGGHALENAREVLLWCAHLLGRLPGTPLQPEMVRLAAPLREAELGSRILQRLQEAAAEESAGAPTRGTAPGAQRRPAAAAAARTAGLAASTGGKVRPLPSPTQLARGHSGSSGGDARPAQDVGTDPSAAAPPAPIKTAAPRRALALRCATCGLTTHPTDECPLAVVSPPSLIRPASVGGAHRLFSLLLPSESNPVLKAGASGSGSGEDVPSPQMLSLEQLRAQLLGGEGGGSGELPAAAAAPEAAAAPSGGPAAGEGEPTVKPISADVQRAFAPYPQLLTFVAALPSAHTREAFSRWAERLTGHISDVPPPLPRSEDEVPVGGYRWTPTREALAILRQLATAHVNLAILESTGIAGAVAQLRNHREAAIAAEAEAITARWREAAVAALSRATGGRERG